MSDEFLNDPENDPEIKQLIEREKKFDAPFTAGALGAARGITFGLSDQALTKSGLVSEEDLNYYKDQNKIASVLGEVGGVVGSTIALPGAGLVGGVAKVGAAGERLVASALRSSVSDSVIKNLVKKSLAKTVGSSVEGAFYGAGQLVSEEALGDAEFNAESILNNVGFGAATGAVVGSIFGAFDATKPILNKITKKSGSLLSDVIEKSVSKEDAALSVLKVDKAARSKISAESKQLLPDMLKEVPNLDKFRNASNAKKFFSDVSKDMKSDMKMFSEFLDDGVLASEGIQELNKQNVFFKLADSVDQNVIKKFPEMEGIDGVKRFYSGLAKVETDVTGKSFGSIKLGDLIEKRSYHINQISKKSGDMGLMDKAHSAVVTELDSIISSRLGEIKSIVTSPESVSAITSLEKNFKYTKALDELIPNINKELSMNDIRSFSTVLNSAYKVKEIVTNDVVGRVSLMADLEKNAVKLARNIEKSSKSFADGVFSGKSNKGRVASLSILNSSALSGKSKDQYEAFNNIKDKLEEFDSNPELLINNIAAQSVKSASALPNTYSYMTPKISSILSYIKAKMPSDPKDLFSPHRVIKSNWKPSSMQLNKFSRVLRAAEKPSSLLDDMENGTVTREAADTVRELYPAMMSRIQENLLNSIKDMKLSRSQKTQLTYILGSDVDGMYNGSSIADYQRIYVDNQTKGMENQVGQSEGINNSYLEGSKLPKSYQSGTEAVSRGL